MKKLYLGVAREIITPEIGGQLYGYRPDVFSESVEDDLTATAYYFKQGDRQALMVSLTVCLIRTQLAQEILELIEKTFFIPKGNCILNATHTHSGPNTSGETGWGDIDRAYCDKIFIPQIISAVRKAIDNVQPVRMGVASGNSLVGINRRELNLHNDIVLGQNPWACFNPEMTVISFADESGKCVANLIHYGAHGTAAGLNHEITRDWSGLMVDAVEEKSGAITAFFNGPEGDVGPRLSNGYTVGDITYVCELGAIAARDAVEIYAAVTDYADAELAVSEKSLSVPLKKRMDYNKAYEMLEKYKNETVNASALIRRHLSDVISSYDEGVADEEYTLIPQTLIGLGDVIFAAFPYELFSEIGMRIDRAFDNKKVLSLSNTNGSESYMITQDALCRGGYEVDMFLYSHTQPFADNADYHLAKGTIEHIKTICESEG